MSFEDWQKQNQQIGTSFESWQAENEIAGISLPTGGTLEEFGKGLVDTFLQSGKGIVQVAGKYSPLGKTIQTISPETHEEFYGGVSEKIESARQPFEMTHQGIAAQAGRILGNAVGYMGQALAGGYTAGPVGAAMVGFNIEGQNAYDEAIASGATERQAETERLIVGSINAAIEALQIGKLMKFQSTGKHSVKSFINAVRTKSYRQMGQLGKEFGSQILRTSIEEGLEEFAQEGVSVGVPAALRDDYPVKPDGTPDWLAIGERLGAAGVGGAFAGGVLGAGGAVIKADVLAPSREKIEGVAQKIRESDLSDRAKGRMIKDLEKLLPEKINLGNFDRVVFRGTSTATPLDEGAWGPGPYFTTDKSFAQEFAAGGYEGKVEQKQIVLSNPFTFTEDTLIEDVIGQELKKVKELEEQQIKETGWTFSNNERDIKVGQLLQERLKKEGYDGIVKDDGREIIPFYPESQIKELDQQLEIPESIREVLDLADNVAETLKEMQARRKELEEYVKVGRSKIFAKQTKILEEMQSNDPLIAKKLAQRVAKEELRKDFPDIAEQFSQEDYRTLVQSVNTATDIDQGERNALLETMDDLFVRQKPPGKARLKSFDKFFGTDIMTSSKNISTTRWQQILRTTADVMNIPKAILASFDVSMPLRQAWHYTMSHPIKSIPSWGKMLKAFVSNKYSDFVAMEMQTNPNYDKFIKAGLEQTKPGSRTGGEEYFQGELAHRIPGIGRIVKASERAAVTYMNAIRLQAANHFYDIMGSPDTNTKAFQDMIDFVNHSTSRGGFKGRAGKWFKKWSPELGAIFWTPKMIVGKVQSIADLRKPEIRKLVACETVRAFGGATLAAMLLALGFGGKFGKDPRSSDFGKVVIGKTRLDMYGTYLPMFRVISQFAIGERKAATTGRISDVERKEVITRFLRSKLNPTAGVAWDIWTGQTFLGKKMKYEGDFLAEYIYEHITPLFIQDLGDAVKYQGFDTLTFVAPLAVHGAGAATYEPTPRGDEVELKNHYARQTYGKGWDELGPAAQKVLRAFRPEIVKAEEQTRAAREDYTFIGKLAQEEQDAGNRVQKKLSKSVQKEMDRLAVGVGGLRRQLRGDWYINKKRYNQYQSELKSTLDKAISNLISNPSWYRLNDEVQAIMLEITVDQCKKLIRQRIVNQANIKDLEKMQR